MKRLIASAAAALCLLATPALANGYPGKGKAIDQLHPAADYSDVAAGRPLALGIMRARANGFVPSPLMQAYANGVLAKLLRGVPLPPSFQPQVRVLAAPEFSALCTPDGTIIITVGLLEQLDNEDELAFILGHEVSHAIYRHHEKDWANKAQYYAVVNGAAVQGIADAALVSGAAGGGDIARGLDVARHLAKLSANVLGPQMSQNQEDAADALGFDLMVRAGYDGEAATAVMDKLAAQEAEAAAAAAAARDASRAGKHGGGGFSFGNVLGAVNNAMSGNWTDLAIFAFDTYVDNMSEEAVAHHPAPERLKLLSNYAFREYRDTLPAAPTPLPWAEGNRTKDGIAMTAMLAHYAAAENAAAYLADSSQGTADSARSEVTRSSTTPTADHAYTQFVAYEYYDRNGNKPQSEAALVRAANGPEASWEIYSRLIDLHLARDDFPGALTLMDQATVKFEDSPVLLPKHIQILAQSGDTGGAEALLPKCKSYKIDELYDACKKAAGNG
ncbi:MAG: M48 family metallopeptidase [Alphaproteobacteria bacterium]|nr:M48 family metallopeptidase [Alphaproteobacteria bacterium]MBL7098064.1 M48 family metallopeptidase [Alphaproteobacteria bacterium]